MNFDIAYVSVTVLYEIIYMIALFFFFKTVFGAEGSKNWKKHIVGIFWYVCILGMNYIGQYIIIKHQKTVLLLIVAFLINLVFVFKTAIFLHFMFKKTTIITGFSLFYTVVDYWISYTVCAVFGEITKITQTQKTVIFCGIIWQTFIILLSYILMKKSKRNRLSFYLLSLSNAEYILISIFLFLVYLVEIGVFNSDIFPIVKVVMVVIVLMLASLIVFVFVIKEKNVSTGNMLIVLEEQMQSITGYYDELKNKDEEIRRFRHDIKNLLYVLDKMLAGNKTQEAREYIIKMAGTFQAATAQYNTGCYIADAILASKQKTAEEISTEIKINGPIPARDIKDVDMVILLSNLLDNAIEACAKIEGEKEIILESYIKKGKWMLKISNPVAQKPLIVNNRILTTKDNKRIHGIGILNIQRVVEKYSGNVLFLSDEKQFEAEMFLLTDNKKGRKHD